VTFTGAGAITHYEYGGSGLRDGSAAVSSFLDVVDDRKDMVDVDCSQATTWFDFYLVPTRFLDIPLQHGINGI